MTIGGRALGLCSLCGLTEYSIRDGLCLKVKHGVRGERICLNPASARRQLERREGALTRAIKAGQLRAR